MSQPSMIENRRTTPKLRILLAKPGLDGHDRGVKVIARALSDAGMEVIYLGLRQTAKQIAAAAVQEDVDVVAISILSGAHMTIIPELLENLRASGAPDIPVVVGGIIPDDDAASLLNLGVKGVLGPGASIPELVAMVAGAAKRRVASGAAL